MNRSHLAAAVPSPSRHALGASWSTQNRQGRLKAQSLIARMSGTTDPTLLGREVQGMVGNDRLDGVAVGFFQELSERLITASASTELAVIKASALAPSDVRQPNSRATTPAATPPATEY